MLEELLAELEQEKEAEQPGEIRIQKTILSIFEILVDILNW